MLRRRTVPLFALAAVLFVAAVVLGGVAGGVAAFFAVVAFLVACIRSLGLAVRDDPDRLRGVVREDGIRGLMALDRGDRGRRKPPTPPPGDKPWP
jgi:hypothetical protein